MTKEMLINLVVAVALLASSAMDAVPARAGEAEVTLTEVATSSRQWTGVAVSNSGRVFVNFPRWSPDVPVSVGELNKDGQAEAYPSLDLNRWKSGDDPDKSFVCVQSVYVDGKDRLWILDPANPMFGGVIEGGAKLMRVDLERDSVKTVYGFDAEIAPQASYLNDVRVDTKTETAYITDSGLGAIVVLDLKTGKARRLLDDHPSTGAENIQITIDKNPFPIVVHSDGIALDSAGGWLYYQALTGRTLYRVSTSLLRDLELGQDDLEAAVEKFATSGVSDGLLFAHGGVYVSALEEGSIKFVDSNGKVTTVVTDNRIVWPDSFAFGADGSVFFTTSQIHLGPNPPGPYRILKFPNVTQEQAE
ncbi:MAG: hypothetical protein JSW50_03550 [Candidatus Latescibacterota bacterium]|nr:MAG: hypothetical protein JSW50_03550 [Candidatus Latescibacterota bacterium]